MFFRSKLKILFFVVSMIVFNQIRINADGPEITTMAELTPKIIIIDEQGNQFVVTNADVMKSIKETVKLGFLKDVSETTKGFQICAGLRKIFSLSTWNLGFGGRLMYAGLTNSGKAMLNLGAGTIILVGVVAGKTAVKVFEVSDLVGHYLLKLILIKYADYCEYRRFQEASAL